MKPRTREYFWTNVYAPEGLNLTCKPCMKADLLARYQQQKSDRQTAAIAALLGNPAA
jgi:hypothetical protein